MSRRTSRRFSRDAKLERLSEVQLFSACTKRDLARIASLAEEIDVPPGRELTRRGERGHECFVVLAGSVRADLPDDRAVTLGPGSCFGEMALLDAGDRSATVTAESDTRLLVLGSREFFSLIEDFPSVARRVMAALATRLREAEEPQPQH
jgi:CRP/FNR family transcriptional regulator, cyclic AMP receptor protein